MEAGTHHRTLRNVLIHQQFNAGCWKWSSVRVDGIHGQQSSVYIYKCQCIYIAGPANFFVRNLSEESRVTTEHGSNNARAMRQLFGVLKDRHDRIRQLIASLACRVSQKQGGLWSIGGIRVRRGMSRPQFNADCLWSRVKAKITDDHDKAGNDE